MNHPYPSPSPSPPLATSSQSKSVQSPPASPGIPQSASQSAFSRPATKTLNFSTPPSTHASLAVQAHSNHRSNGSNQMGVPRHQRRASIGEDSRTSTSAVNQLVEAKVVILGSQGECTSKSLIISAHCVAGVGKTSSTCQLCPTHFAMPILITRFVQSCIGISLVNSPTPSPLLSGPPFSPRKSFCPIAR